MTTQNCSRNQAKLPYSTAVRNATTPNASGCAPGAVCIIDHSAGSDTK
jgi:hypothetical protein